MCTCRNGFGGRSCVSLAALGAGRGGKLWSSKHFANKAEYSEREKAPELIPGAVDDARVKIAEKPKSLGETPTLSGP